VLTAREDVALQAAVVAAGSAAVPLGQFAPLRKEPPKFGPVELSGHFLKHADEQTIVALQAIGRAVKQYDLDPRQMADWGIVAAPRYIGRLAGASILDRFANLGGSGVLPHTVAQNSLHSISGAASIALGLHGPNVGVGGGPWAIGDGLVAALTLFDTAHVPGIWLLLTQFDPEPIPDEVGRPLNESVCHAVALALVPGSEGESQLTLRPGTAAIRAAVARWPEPNVAEIAAVARAASRGLTSRWACWLPWGGRVELRLATASGALRFAA
jgi:hypothetical protein